MLESTKFSATKSPPSGGGELEILIGLGEIFLSGGENLRSDFGDSNLFQS